MKVSRVTEMRAMDRTAIERYGIIDEILMENAGQAVHFTILQRFGIANKRFLVFCGIGNNGGDGFVVARKILSTGGMPKVIILGDKGKYQGSAKRNLEIIETLPIETLQLESIESIRSDLAHCDAVVDAIFGTGLVREVEGLYREVIESINASWKTVFSVDIPSGVNGDTGKIMGTAVRADYTVTFGLPKLGNMLLPGFDLCGELFVTHISFPPEIYEDDSIKVAINSGIDLPRRDPDGHKGDFGKALFIAGASSYFGAPYFAALSFLKAGGGYSRLASPKSITPFIANKGSEIVFIPLNETLSGSIAFENRDNLLELANSMDFVVLGPGLSLDHETQELARELIQEITRPLLIDGDGISALCRDLDIIHKRTEPTVLTPHLGEMARIKSLPIDEIDSNKIDILQKTCHELNTIIVLKGANSLIGYPDERVYINTSGNPGMASAGSGDVLTGTIAAMFGLGLPIEDAVRKGVFMHGFAGDLAACDIGMDGITAQDILEYLPQALKMDREGLPEELKTCYLAVQVV
ncbi:MAG: NAD(P)H-hydrate dehydratase [Deltaproteobacteria bacterium]|nr:NAD(P)H-hydrate dehydratase [Deltaproteobacteria bacterium]